MKWAHGPSHSPTDGPITAGDNRNETVAAIKGQVSWYLLWTLSGAVGGVGTVRAASGRSGDVRIHLFSTDAALTVS